MSRLAALPDDRCHRGSLVRRALVARERDADGSDRSAEVVEGRRGHRGQAIGHVPVLLGPAAAAFEGELGAQLGERPGSGARAVDEARSRREEGADLGGGKVREHRSPDRGELGRKPYAYVSHQRHRVARLLLEQVQSLGSVEDAEVCGGACLGHRLNE